MKEQTNQCPCATPHFRDIEWDDFIAELVQNEWLQKNGLIICGSYKPNEPNGLRWLKIALMEDIEIWLVQPFIEPSFYSVDAYTSAYFGAQSDRQDPETDILAAWEEKLRRIREELPGKIEQIVKGQGLN